jgi:glyoxylase-like metal-dependent hydrolase (beta-lactamase superfamily II)
LPAPEVVTLTTGPFAENCYLLADPDTREAVVIDPGDEAELFLARLGSERWTPRAIWLTHGHLDHVTGVARVKQATGVPVLIHPADRKLYHAARHQAALFGLSADAPPEIDGELADGQWLMVGGLRFEVMHTPGHTAGGVTFHGHGVAFVGDALFAGSIGRTDLPGGDTETLARSIRTRLYRLPDETVVYSGHGPETTIGREKRSNPFVRLTPGIDACLKCGAEVQPKPWGCKNPCPNCGHVYPLGDCSD